MCSAYDWYDYEAKLLGSTYQSSLRSCILFLSLFVMKMPIDASNRDVSDYSAAILNRGG